MFKYSYVVLKYVHDAVRDESVNVAVLVMSKEANFLRLGIRNNLKDLKNIFSDLDTGNLRSNLKQIAKSFDKLELPKLLSELNFTEKEITHHARAVLSQDFSALRWQSEKSGITKDIEKTFSNLLSKLVDVPSITQFKRREDDDVWHKFSPILRSIEILDSMQEKDFRIGRFKESYEHTFQNGKLHCFIPLSLDYATEETLMNRVKAEKGKMQIVVEHARQELEFYFLLGKPSKAELIGDYSEAKEIFEKASNVHVVSEDHPEKLSEFLKSAVQHHKNN